MAAEPAPIRREQAVKVVAEEIAGALQIKIAQWQAERSRIEAIMQREDRKRQRFDLLGELIAAAETEIQAAMNRMLPTPDVVGDQK